MNPYTPVRICCVCKEIVLTKETAHCKHPACPWCMKCVEERRAQGKR